MDQVGARPADTGSMTNVDPHEWASGPGASQPRVNQFGTPVNQFGTPTGLPGSTATTGPSRQFGGPVNQFGNPASFGPPSQQWSTPAARRSSGSHWVVGLGALALVVAAGVVGRTYVFPDLSKPIDLPATVASVSTLSQTPGQPITVQSKDSEGRATAMSVYADDVTVPQTMLVVTAGRAKNLGTERITESTRSMGKVTCTDNVATSALLAQAGADTSAAAAAMVGLRTGAACWRTGRHLTVMVVALTAHDAAQSTARQAVAEAWDAI